MRPKWYSIIPRMMPVGLLLLWSQGVAVAGQGPKIVFEEVKLEQGVYLTGTRVDAVFRYRNEGDERLRISEIKTSCGACTAAAVGSPITEPGGEGDIKATVRTAGRTGRQTFTIYVTSNDPVSPTTTLELTFTLQQQIRCVPEKVDFGRVEPGSEIVVKTVRIEALSPKPPEMSLGRYDQSLLRLELTTPTLSQEESPKTDEEGRNLVYSRDLHVGVAESARPGPFLETISLETGLPNVPVVRIPVVGEVPAPVELEKTDVFFGIIRDNGPVKRSVRLKVTEPGFQLGDIDTDIAELSATATPDKSGYQVNLLLDPTKASGLVEGSVLIHTNSAYAPELRIQVTGMVKPK